VLYELINRGEIAHVMIGSRRYVSRDQISAFIEANTHTGYYPGGRRHGGTISWLSSRRPLRQENRSLTLDAHGLLPDRPMSANKAAAL
jgi:hypothetical protein